MYKSAAGDEYFVIDSHMHMWDGTAENHKNIHGKQFIDCFYDYHSALSQSDLILLAPIYSAGENRIEGVNNQNLATCIKEIHPNLPVLTAQNRKELLSLIESQTRQGDLVITMGAGDINKLWEDLTKEKPTMLWQASRLAA